MATTVSLKPNAVEISGSTSGTTTLQATAVAGTTTLTLPSATDTLVGRATTDTLTNKTLTGAAMNGTLGATTPSTASVTTLTTSSTVTHNGGTANGVAYLDSSKVLTTGSALVFDASGQLLIGNTSATPTPAKGFCFNNPAGDTYVAIGHPNGSAPGNFYAIFNYNSSVIGSITQNGTTGVLFNTSSDYRLKEITGPVTGAKNFIMALQPKQGTWKSDGSAFIGFLAHEFQEVSPASVSGVKDAVDADGKPIMQSMQASSSEVMANIVAFIQEQQSLITQLQADVAALKGA